MTHTTASMRCQQGSVLKVCYLTGPVCSSLCNVEDLEEMGLQALGC
uniref:Uncharacterized protein n=1 Tax=Triticum urartu TaxID=4572 RepID=A0A8R7U0H1_TRIUA